MQHSNTHDDNVAPAVPPEIHAKLVDAVVESGRANLGCEAIDTDQGAIAVRSVLTVLANAGLLVRGDALAGAGADAPDDREDRPFVRRWIATGEPFDENDITRDDLLRAAGRALDKACAHDVVGTVLFEAMDGTHYTVTVEAIISPASESFVAETLDEIEADVDAETV